MKIGLIQVDGKWANLALMRLSSWHRAQGDTVEWYSPLFDSFDRVYASKISTETPDYEYIGNEVVKGGSGYDLKTVLDQEVEDCFPDYSLYPNIDYALGFTTRGCPRTCLFCVVPEKEGKLRIVGDINSFWNGQSKVILLDNNLTAASMKHFERITNQLKEINVKVDFSQGLDLRLLNEEHCYHLKGVKLFKPIKFSWDNVNDETKIIQGIELFKRSLGRGTARITNIMVYVLIGFNTTPEEDLYRVEKLREQKVDSYVMPFDKKDPYQRMFQRYVNAREIFRSIPWSEYNRRSAKRLQSARVQPVLALTEGE